MSEVMSLVDQVIPKLGDSYWPLMEREFVKTYRLKFPEVFEGIQGQMRDALRDAGYVA